jgi:hypothetical protein
MVPNTGHRKRRIRVTVAEQDLKDALLILHCYTCSEYVVASAHGCCDALSATAANRDPASITKIEITAKCAASAIPALLDELATSFGRQPCFQTVVDTEQPPL